MLILTLLTAAIGYYGYTSFGVTSFSSFSTSEVPFTIQPRSEVDLPPMNVSGDFLACVKVNSTGTFSMDIYVAGRLTYRQSSTDSIKHCTELNDQGLKLNIRSLSDHPIAVAIRYDVDGAPIRRSQMIFAPSFTLLPMLILTLLSSREANVRLRRTTPPFWWLYFLVIFPLMTTTVILQLSLIIHSATGGASIRPLEYYTYPLSYIQFYIVPSEDLLTVLALSTELWLVYLPIAAVLVVIGYLAWRWLFKPVSKSLTDLLTRRDAVGVLSCYYLAGALFSVVLMGIAAYGAGGLVEWLSIPYAESLAAALSPVLSFFDLPVTSFKAVMHLMLLGVAFAMLSRILVAIDPGFPRTAFSKTLTAISFLTIPALAVSPKFAETYYLSLASIGFSVIPFFAFCIVVGLADWLVSKLVTRFLESRSSDIERDLREYLMVSIGRSDESRSSQVLNRPSRN
jgi:hypothetical protein